MPALPAADDVVFRPSELALPSQDGIRRENLGPTARNALREAQERLQAWNAAGATGADVVVAYTEVVDRLIRFLYEGAARDYSRRNVVVGQKCAVLAQGGYGRGELNPGSDVDLLFLYSWKVNAFLENVAETILYSLWDTGLQVGHAVRSIPECIRLSAVDFKVRTALLDTRFLAGDEALFAEFDKAVRKDILRRSPDRFFQDKLAENDERHRQYGDSVYLLEPHIKEGEGGLRDLHTAMWMARIKFKIDTFREIVHKGVVTEREFDAVLESRNFLWKVRNTLHFLAAGHQDQLTFEYQDRVAEILGYRDADERRAVERFLQDYYLHAARIRRFAKLVIERCLEKTSPYRRFGRMFRRVIRPGVSIQNGEITLDQTDFLERDPTNVVELFLDSQRHGVGLSARSQAVVTGLAPRLAAARDSPAVVRPFLEILRGRSRVHETLREMHSVGVLDHVLPEFGQLNCMVIRDFYHIYTVDEHTLRGVMELEKLAAGDYRDTAPLLTEVMREIDRRDVLYLSMILHDVGKGHGQGHSDRGAKLAEAVARRLGFHEDDVAQIERLVRHHLLMSHVAQHRDLHDARVVNEFARHVGSADVLKKLYVMTFADMRAVAPNVWNNWRDLMLGELFMRALDVFEKGEFVEEAWDQRVGRTKERLRARVLEREPALAEPLDKMLATMPASYFLSTPEDRFPHHLSLLRELDQGGSSIVTSVRHHPEREFSEFTVVTPDRPGLFSMITGVLTAGGQNIVGAQITTSTDGIALDVFRLSHGAQSRTLQEDRWQRIRETLEMVLRGEASVEALVARSKPSSILTRRPLPHVPTTVTIDNQDSDHFSLVEVSTRDQIGVLFSITNTLYHLGCPIHLAKISTVLHHVYDVFYVTDRDGRKITSGDRIREVTETVRHRLDADTAVEATAK